jgi:hypothetical protein
MTSDNSEEKQKRIQNLNKLEREETLLLPLPVGKARRIAFPALLLQLPPPTIKFLRNVLGTGPKNDLYLLKIGFIIRK